MGNSLYFGCLPDRFIRLKTALRVDEVGRENSIYKSRFAQSSLTYKPKINKIHQ